MASFDSCAVSTNSTNKLPMPEIRDVAKQYERRGMKPEAALLRSLEDQLEMAQMAERRIVQAVRGAYTEQGGRPRPAAPTVREQSDVRYSVASDLPMSAIQRRVQELMYAERGTALNDGGQLAVDMLDLESQMTDAEFDERANGEWQDAVRVPLNADDTRRALDRVNGMPWHHGSAITSLAQPGLNSAGALFLASDPDVSRNYAGADGRVYDVAVNVQRPFFVASSDLTADMESSGEIERLKAQGFDAIVPLDYGDMVVLSELALEQGVRYSVSGDVTDSPAFREWFGASQIVDENGNPLVVYHGANSYFSEFKPSESGAFGPGIYLADTPEEAERWARRFDQGEPRIMQVYVAMRNPYHWDSSEDGHRHPDMVNADARAAGHDGVIRTWGDGTREIVAFSPEQIKSATDNNGEFSPDNPDIRYSITPEQAAAIRMETRLPDDPLFAEAVANTPGASIGPEGLRMNLVRFQQEDQEGAQSIRTGVFYLPTGSANAKHYKTGKTGYGGTQKHEGETVLRAPLFVKGATGGKAPEAAYDAIKGKGAAAKLRSDILRVIMNKRQLDENGYNLLEEYGADGNMIWDIVANSTQGNTLAYALQENIIAHAVREAGYDSVVGYSKGKAGAAISEVFDVREATYPARGMNSQIHDHFRVDYFSLADMSQARAPLASISPLIQKLADGGAVVVHADSSTLPGGRAPAGVQALTERDGTIHLVASSLTDANARAVLLHEAFHAGAEKLVGTEQWNKLMQRLESLHKMAQGSTGPARTFFDKAKQRVASAKARGAVAAGMEAEEFGAYAIEEYESAPPSIRKWVDDFVGLVKAWALARFGQQLGDVTPAQLSGLARLALLDVRAARMQEAYSLDRRAPGRGGDRRARTIQVDGERRPIEDSDGNLVAPDFMAQMEFWRNYTGPVDPDGHPILRNTSAFDGASDTFTAEHLADGLPGDAEFLRQLGNTRTFQKFGLGGFDVPSRGVVLARVRNVLQDFQIRKAVIELIPVDVMNILAGKQLTSEVLLDDVSMLTDLLTPNGNNSVSLLVDVARDIADAVTRVTTEHLASHPDAGARSGDADAAMGARNGDGVPLGGQVAGVAAEDATRSGNVRGEAGNRNAAGQAGVGLQGSGQRSEFSIAYNPDSDLSTIAQFDPGNADIRYSVAPGPLPRQAPAATWTAPEATRIDQIVHTLQDKFIDMKRVVQAIRKTSGDIGDKFDPYLQEELFHGRSATGFKSFLDGELKPLLVDMQARGVALADFEQYLVMRHAEETNIQIARINPEMPDGGSGVETQKARDYLANLPPEKASAYQALAARVDAMVKGTQQTLLDYGLEKQETIDAWNGAYKHYVPLAREDMDTMLQGAGTGQGFSIRGSSSKRRVGSDKGVVNVLANLAQARERAIVRGEKNRLDLALYGLALKAPNPSFWKPVNPKKNPAALQAELTAMGLPAALVQNYMDEPTQKTVVPVAGGTPSGQSTIPGAGPASHEQVVRRVNTMLRSAPNVIAVRVAGEDRFIFFNERDERALRMAKSLKNLTGGELNRFLELIGKGTRWFASVNTQYNPIFGVVNLLRDAQGVALNLTSTPLNGKQAQVEKELARMLWKAGRQWFRLDSLKGADAALWQEFQREGGITGYRAMFAGGDERHAELEAELRRMSEGKFKKAGRAVFDWLSDYNEALENVTRMAAYKVAKESGMTPAQAASLAKNITTNFNRKGNVASQVGALYAFFNAAVQGTTRIAQTLDPRTTSGKAIIGGGLLLGTIQAVMLAAAGFEDDEPPEFIQAKNLVIPNPFSDAKDYVTIPMPLGFNVLPTISRIATQFMLSGGKRPAKRITDLMGAVLDSFNPIGHAGFSMQTILPTVVDPLAALESNRDYTGKKIYNEDMNTTSPTPGHTRARAGASIPAKLAAEGINAVLGGNDYVPGVWSPTPEHLEYLTGQLTGGVGREILKGFQTGQALATGEELAAHRIPLAGRFYGTTEDGANVRARFMDNLVELNLLKQEYEGRAEDKNGAREFKAANPILTMADEAQAVQREVSKLNKEKRRLMESDAPRDRIKLMDEKIRTRMEKFNAKVLERREKLEAAQ